MSCSPVSWQRGSGKPMLCLGNELEMLHVFHICVQICWRVIHIHFTGIILGWSFFDGWISHDRSPLDYSNIFQVLLGKKSKFFQWQIRFPHHFWINRINRINFKSCPTWKVLPSRDSHPKCQPTIDFAICSAAGALPHFQRWFHPSEKLILTYPNHDAFEKMKCFSNASNKNNHPKVHRYISKLEIRNTHCLRILRNTVSRLFYLLQDDNIQTTTILEDTSINP